MSHLIQLPASAITLKHGVPMTTSLLVAETFEKLHKNVLRHRRHGMLAGIRPAQF